MFKYYIYFDEYVEVEEQFFKDLINLYSTKFEILKFDFFGNPFCESEMLFNDSLCYYFRDAERNKLIFFAKLYKISND